MWLTTPRFIFAGVLSTLLAAGCNEGCNNDNFSNRGVITAGPRFQLIVEKEAASRLLLDSVTGDLWQLRMEPTGTSQWVRVASGPTDVRVLRPQEALGALAHPTPQP